MSLLLFRQFQISSTRFAVLSMHCQKTRLSFLALYTLLNIPKLVLSSSFFNYWQTCLSISTFRAVSNISHVFLFLSSMRFQISLNRLSFYLLLTFYLLFTLIFTLLTFYFTFSLFTYVFENSKLVSLPSSKIPNLSPSF